MPSLLPVILLAALNQPPLPDGALLRLGPAGGRVYAVTFSPDGKRLACGGHDGTIRLWDVASGKPVRCLKGHGGPVRAVAFAPDGRTLVAGSQDKTASLWDLASGKQIQRLTGHSGSVNAVAFAPDGKTAASAGCDGQVRLWHVATGKAAHVLTGHRGPVYALAFSPRGPLLVSGGRDRTVRFWDPAAGKQLRLVRGPGWVFAVGFSGDGRVVGSGGQAQMVHLWEAATGERLDQFGGYEGPVHAVALAGDGRMTASAGDDGKVRLWENDGGKVRQEFAGHRGPVLGLALASDGWTLASAAKDGVIFLWDVTGRWKDGRLRPAELSEREWRSRWADLGSPDAPKAFRAMAEFMATPARTLSLFEQRFGPMLALRNRIDRLVPVLEAPRYVDRRKALDELEQMGELALPGLKRALDGRPPLETRLRLEQLVRRLQGGDEDTRFSVRRQILRAVEVLEAVGTPGARALLTRLARGLPVPWGKREAQASLDRLRNHR